MSKLFLMAVVFIGLLVSSTEVQGQNATSKSKNQKTEKVAIEKLILAYQDALNASDASKVINLYTPTGVLMANAAPTAEGAEQVKGTYQYVFDNFTYALQFTILEIEVNGNTAFARSTSKGSFVIKASGQTVPDENRELFVFQKVNGQWKIARYMYNKNK
ncbi:MAG: DUF4440 domain-containing protein [Phycisphaerae bacterium]|nr:DUF4440 domain-containing protein [Saprospiraceae bacterium]